MKKLSLIIFSLMLLFVGGVSLQISSAVFAETSSPSELIEVKVQDENDFINKLSQEDNYKGKRLILTQALDFSTYDLSELYAKGYTFSGEFDGNGYTISNLTISSSGNSYGLFSQTENALIHNLKLDGTLCFKLNESTSEIFAGAIVGRGELTTIQNCQLSSDLSFQTYLAEGNLQYLQFTTKSTFGSFAGCLENGSVLNSCVNLSSTVVDEKIDSPTSVKYGGMVGRLFNSSALYCVNYGSLTYNGRNASITFYNGGIVGEVEGSMTKVINCAFHASIKVGEMENLANAINGAVVGRILDNSPARGNLAFDYFTCENSAFGQAGSYTLVSENHVEQVSSLPLQFFMNENNWHTLYPIWNFDTVWIVGSNDENSVLKLQCFESFEYAVSSQLDTGLVINDAYFTGGIANENAHVYRYNDDVILTFNFKDSHKGYYQLRQILLNSNVLANNLYESEAICNIQGQILGYKIKTKASNLTAGTYSFTLKPITFECLVEVAEFKTKDDTLVMPGDVRYYGGSNGSEKLNINLTYASAPQTIVATAKIGSIFTFQKWKLYYYGDGDWDEIEYNGQDFIYLSGNSNLKIEFGTAPFNQRFKLVAFFTDTEAIQVSFNKDVNIESIKFSGIEYENVPIQVSSSANVELMVVTKPHYRISEQLFIDSIAGMYGEQGSVDNLVRSKVTDEETGVTTYIFNINMRYINTYLNNAKELTFNLFSEQVQNEGETDLLWLWIVIPIVGVLAIGGIVTFILVRNYRYKHGAGKFGGTKGGKNNGKGGKEDKAKKPDFKDFYY